jgi:hypothetical protein
MICVPQTVHSDEPVVVAARVDAWFAGPVCAALVEAARNPVPHVVGSLEVVSEAQILRHQ